jgi:hypothetical protein
MFRFACGNRGGLFECQPACFAGASTPPEPRVRRRANLGQRFVEQDLQLEKCREVRVVYRPLLRLLPLRDQRLVGRRIRRPRIPCAPPAVGLPNWRRRLAGVRLRPSQAVQHGRRGGGSLRLCKAPGELSMFHRPSRPRYPRRPAH